MTSRKDLALKIIWLILPLYIMLLDSHQTFSQTPSFWPLYLSPAVEKTDIKKIFQDSEGFIWLGTSEAVYRYDGFKFDPYLLSDSVNIGISCIGMNAKERIWIGYENGTLAYIENDVLKPLLSRKDTLKKAITGILTDNNDNTWFATYGEGLYYCTNDTLIKYVPNNGRLEQEIYTISIGSYGKIWIGTDAGISIMNPQDQQGQLLQLSTSEGLPDNIIRHLQPYPNGDVWIGTYDKGICKYNVSSGAIDVPKAMKGWGNKIITSLEAISENELWIGTENNGLYAYLIDSDRLHSLNRTNGFNSTKVDHILKDAEGIVWVANSEEGLSLAYDDISFIPTYHGAPLPNVQAITTDHNNDLWFSTQKSFYKYTFRKEGGHHMQKHLSEEYSNENIISIYEDTYGCLWLGTFGNGVLRYDPDTKKTQRYSESEGLINGNVLSISGADGEIWFATLGGVSRVKLNAHDDQVIFENFSKESGLGLNYIYQVFIDSKRRVWFATDGRGVSVLENGKFKSLLQKNGLQSDIVYSITEDQEGNIWLSTSDHSLVKYNGESFSPFINNENLSGNFISGITVDAQGNLLVLHETGIELINIKTGGIFSLGEEVGLFDINPDLNAITKDSHSNIWFGSQNGLIQYKASGPAVQAQPLTSLNAVKVFLDQVAVDQDHIFNPDQNHLSFDYVGLWYKDPELVTYQYSLEGFDIDWKTSKDRVAIYPQLPPGRYNFKVRSSINSSFANAEIASFGFSIAKPFWQKLWFILFFLFCLMGLGLLLVKGREQKLRQKESQKKELVQAQLDTLKSQINPHFLFNSFNTLAAIIEEDKDVAIEYVENLSDFFRNILDLRQKDFIPISEELDLVENYYYLQKKRFGENFRLEVNISDSAAQCYIPPLTLQILVENALKHNIVSQKHPLIVGIYDQKDYLFVKNQKQPKSGDALSTGFGLQSINKRYGQFAKKTVLMDDNDKFYSVGLPLITNIFN